MAPTRRRRDLLLALALSSCGWLPPDRAPARPAPALEEDADLLRAWTITDHALTPRALISDLDAAEFRGREIVAWKTGYQSPWSGSCDDAARQRAPRTLEQLAAAHGLAPDRVASLGLTGPIVAHELTCRDGRALPLTVYVGGGRAAACWSGVCYALTARPPR